MNSYSEMPLEQYFQTKSAQIADQISEIIRLKKISKADIVAKLGITEQELEQWLSGKYDFLLSNLVKIEQIIEEDIIIMPILWNSYKGLFSTDLKKKRDKALKNRPHQSLIKDGIMKPKNQDNEIDNLMPKTIAEKPRIVDGLKKPFTFKNKPDKPQSNNNNQ